MLSLFRDLFGRRSRRFGRFGGLNRRSHALSRTMDRRRGGMTLGTLAALAAPFIIRKLRERRAMRAYGGAY